MLLPSLYFVNLHIYVESAVWSWWLWRGQIQRGGSSLSIPGTYSCKLPIHNTKKCHYYLILYCLHFSPLIVCWKCKLLYFYYHLFNCGWDPCTLEGKLFNYIDNIGCMLKVQVMLIYFVVIGSCHQNWRQWKGHLTTARSRGWGHQLSRCM